MLDETVISILWWHLKTGSRDVTTVARRIYFDFVDIDSIAIDQPNMEYFRF